MAVAWSSAATIDLHAQDVFDVAPGSEALRAHTLEPFEAHYEQLGLPFEVRLSRTRQERPVLAFLMTWNGPNGIGVDHVGHFADDLSLAYRRFGFGGFRDEYMEVEAVNDQLIVRRMTRNPESGDVPPQSMTLDGDPRVVDGTFLYWALGALPLTIGSSWRLPTWSPTAAGAELHDSATFRVTGRDQIELADGSRFDAWIVEASTPRATVRMWVSHRPPYLLRQEMEGADGEMAPVLELKQVRTTGEG